MKSWITVLLVLGAAWCGCSSVPKEVVELSYRIGQDIEAVHVSYRALIRVHFDGLRAQTNDFVENRWIPVYLEKAIAKGKLVSRASDPDPKKVLSGVRAWTQFAIDEIDAKRKELVDPIDHDERDLVASVDDAFEQIEKGNSTITAHLNSLREVQEVQDDALQALGLKNLRDKLNDALVKASERSQQALDAVKKADGVVDEAKEKKEEFIKSINGGN